MRRQFLSSIATILLSTAGLAVVPGAAPAQTPPQIVLGATTAQRREAARALVPLLKTVKAHAQPGTTVKPGGSVPDSPFTGTQTTLFAFTLSKRSVPVDPRVIAAMDRLIAWNIDAGGGADNAALFDRWLVEMEARSSGALRLKGESGLCDVNCVVARMTTLDTTWGTSPKGRADARDELLLDALRVAVLPQ